MTTPPPPLPAGTAGFEGAFAEAARPFERWVREILGDLLRGSAGELLDRVRAASEALEIPEDGLALRSGDWLDAFLAVLDREARGVDLAAAVREAWDRLSGPLGLPLDLLVRPTPSADTDLAAAGWEVPARALARRVVDRDLLLQLADRVDEAILPAVRVLLRVRAFAVQSSGAGTNRVEVQDLLIGLLRVFRESRDELDRRIDVWTVGLLTGLRLAAGQWLSSGKLPAAPRGRALDRARERATERARGYRRALTGVLGALEADIELRRVETRTFAIVRDKILGPTARAGSELVEALQVVLRSLRAAEDRVLRAAERDDPRTLAESITAQRAQILHHIQDGALPIVAAIREAVASQASVEKLRLALDELASDLPEQVELLSPAALDDLARGALPGDLPRVGLRAPTRSVLVTGVPWQVTETRERVVGPLSRVEAVLRQVAAMVEFNFDAALRQTDKGCGPGRRGPRPGDGGGAGRGAVGPGLAVAADGSLLAAGAGEHEVALDLVGGSLRRAVELVAPLPDLLDQASGETVEELKGELAAVLDDLRATVLGRSEVEVPRARSSEAAHRIFKAILPPTRQIAGALRAATREVAAAGRRATTRILGGREVGDAGARLPGDADPEEVGRAQEASLPHAYRMLFTTEPVPSSDLLVGREEPLARIAAALRRVSMGHSASVAVVGAPGSGRSSLLRVARQTLFEGLPTHFIPIEADTREEDLSRALGRRFRLPRAHTLKELAAPLSTLPHPAVVLLDDAESLFSRAPGGFRLLAELAQLVTATSDHVLWVVSVVDPLWRFLAVMGRIPRSFSEVVRLPPLDEAQMATLIERRHALSGYRLAFGRLPLSLRLRALVAPREIMGGPDRRAVFHALHHVSAGNPELGILSWRRCLEPTGDGGLRVQVPRSPCALPLLQEDLDVLATFATLLLQGSIDAGDHAAVFGSTPEASARLLRTLEQRHWLRAVASTGRGGLRRYRIVSSHRTAIYEILRTKGMLP